MDLFSRDTNYVGFVFFSVCFYGVLNLDRKIIGIVNLPLVNTFFF
jgi:hypothetical protein